MMARAMSWACSSSITFNVATNRPSVPFGSSEVSAAISSRKAGRKRLEQTLMHGAGAGLKSIGGIGQFPKGIVGMFVCH